MVRLKSGSGSPASSQLAPPLADVVPRAVTAADVLTCALLLIGLAIAATGGGRMSWWGLRISLTSAARPLALALIVAALRHACYRRRSLPVRLAAIVVRVVRFAGRCAVRGRQAFADGIRHQRPLEPEHAGPAHHPSAVELAAVTLLMVVLTAVMTYPQVRWLDAVRDWGDPVFSIWRLSWIAHQIVRDPLHLFDANILYPARDTLAFSDSLLLPNLVAAPLVWLGARPVVVHSLFLTGSFVLSGVCMYAFAASLTGRRSAGLVAGVAFAFYPYRFDQYSHYEQQLSFWMPLALWALHRTIVRRRLVDGLLTGAAVAGQYLSGMYLGVYFVLWLVPVWLALGLSSRAVRASVPPLLAGAVLAAALIGPTVPPHLAARQEVGERTPYQVAAYSATGHDYMVSNGDRLLYRNTLGQQRHAPERDLFPGVVVVFLALVAVWPPLSGWRIGCTLGLLVAFEASLGANGYLFPFLFKLFLPFRAFRVPARFSMLVGLSLAVLAGFGAARIGSRLGRRPLRLTVTTMFALAIMAESWSVLSFERVPATVHPVYRWFAGRPPAVIANLPFPAGDYLADPECRYMYESTFHWQRMVNGFSGAAPPSYLVLRDALAGFPDDDSLRLLRKSGVQYVVLREGLYGRPRYAALRSAAATRADLKEVFRATDGRAQASIYAIETR